MILQQYELPFFIDVIRDWEDGDIEEGNNRFVVTGVLFDNDGIWFKTLGNDNESFDLIHSSECKIVTSQKPN